MLHGCECYEVDIDQATLKLLQASRKAHPSDYMLVRICISPRFCSGLEHFCFTEA